MLHTAAESGADACVAFLVKAQPQLLHESDLLRENAAHKAAKHGHTHTYRLLCAHGAPYDLENIEVPPPKTIDEHIVLGELILMGQK